ncbi:MAG: hypothetical protein MK135_14350, partial [Polyangiaceae bacterium]|nr:hypothetical protein [Polyangiaceae bacterium]
MSKKSDPPPSSLSWRPTRISSYPPLWVRKGKKKLLTRVDSSSMEAQSTAPKNQQLGAATPPAYLESCQGLTTRRPQHEAAQLCEHLTDSWLGDYLGGKLVELGSESDHYLDGF